MPALHRLAEAPKLQRDTISRIGGTIQDRSTGAEHMAVLAWVLASDGVIWEREFVTLWHFLRSQSWLTWSAGVASLASAPHAQAKAFFHR
jgi:hypothetical protein